MGVSLDLSRRPDWAVFSAGSSYDLRIINSGGLMDSRAVKIAGLAFVDSEAALLYSVHRYGIGTEVDEWTPSPSCFIKPK